MGMADQPLNGSYCRDHSRLVRALIAARCALALTVVVSDVVGNEVSQSITLTKGKP